MENIYIEIKKEKSNSIIEKEDIKKVYSKVDKYVEEAFKTIYKKNENYKITGSQIIVKNVIINYVNLVLKKDERYTPFEITSVEDKDLFITEIEIAVNNKIKKVSLSGIIDRIDKKEGIYRVIDYKTGKPQNSFNSIDELFDTELKSRAKHVLQTLIYALIFRNSQIPINVKLKPSIFYVRTMKNLNSSEAIYLKQNRKSIELDEHLTEELLSDFSDKLKSTLEYIFNKETPFTQTKNEKNCEWCNFKDLCH